MPRRAKVFDSWALMAFLTYEPAADKVEEIINEAHATETPLYVSVVNLGEVWYSLVRSRSEADADRGVQELVGLRILPEPVDWQLTRQAAIFKSKYRMSYADCFAAALAKEKKADLVTGDTEFSQLQDEMRIHWLEAS